LGPLLPDDSSRAARLWRRTRNITLELLVLLSTTVLLPVLLLGGGVIDLALWLRRRKPWMTVRLVLVLWWVLVGEAYALAGIFVLFVASLGRDGALRRGGVFKLKRQWLRSHLRALRVLLGVRYEADGLELAGPGPVLVMTRHASIIDNALPDVIIGGAHKIGFRFVIKRELQMLPTIDIAGRWVPTLFVRRGSSDTASELDKMKALCENLGPRDGLLLYPEGTRCTPAKLARAKEVIAERQPEIAPLANRLRHLLPPRLGGALTLLQNAPEADVVIFGHVGLDGFEYISDIWAGGLLNTTVQMKFWRFPASEIPHDDEDALVGWLYERWFELDDWIEAQLAPR
jgi:1-acyl-sn-glycerol-3-phosphate acyltransferase